MEKYFLAMILKRICLGFIFIVTALLYAADCHAATVTLAWDASPEPVDGYIVFYGEQSVLTNPSTQIDVGKVLYYAFTDMLPGHTYFFALKAYNAAGQSVYVRDPDRNLLEFIIYE